MLEEKEELKIIVCKNIKKIRLEKELSQSLVADRADMEHSQYHKYEKKNIDMSLHVLQKIANGLGCSVSELVGN